MSALDWVVIAAYLAATIGLGLWLSRKWSNLLGAGLSIIAVFVCQIPYRGRLALVYRARDLGDGRCRRLGRTAAGVVANFAATEHRE
jgi:hypothetical protein